MTVPEALDYVVNKYAEHTHEKWSMEKVRHLEITFKAALNNY